MLELMRVFCFQIPVQAVEMPGSMNDNLDVQVSVLKCTFEKNNHDLFPLSANNAHFFIIAFRH